MRQCLAFIKKEWMESFRTGKVMIIMILFVLFGIMNPAIAKLTPWLMEHLSEDLEQTGIIITKIEPNALDSWVQFYKNIPMALIIFLLVFSGILTVEYQKSTLIHMVTKGMKRWKIITSKLIPIITLWTVGYWLCYGITWGYTIYFWDNTEISHLIFPAVCFYLLGIWLISLLILVSAVFRSNSSVIAVVFIVFLLLYFIGFWSSGKSYLPVKLLDSSELLVAGNCLDYLSSIVVTLICFSVNIIAAILCFNKKNL